MRQILGYMFLVFPLLHGYSYGPPTSVCSSMMPGHGGTSQASTSPFYIALTATSYRQGQNVTVEVATNDAVNSPFKGFLLQARIAGTSTPTGRFYLTNGDSQVKLMSCSGGNSNTVSHNSPIQKAQKQFTWVSETGGNVYFQATFVKQKMTYWTGIRSNTITEDLTTTTTTITTTTTTTTSTTTPSPTMTSAIATPTTPTTPDSNPGDSSNNNSSTTPPTTSLTTTSGQAPSVNDGATTPSSSQTNPRSAWSLLELIILWAAVTYWGH